MALFPDKIAHGPQFKAGGFGEYFEGPLWTGNSRRVYASTCAHCGTPSEYESIRRRSEAVEVCRKCMRQICFKCVDRPCTPQEMWCEQEERQKLKERIEIDGWGCY
jgi:hypothetical protein